MIPALAWVLGLPRWVKLAAGGILVALLALTLHQCAVSGAVEADRAEIAAEAHKTAREADAASRGAADAVQDDIAKGNDDAREAAKGSSDPLKSGLDRLRAGKAGDRPPAD